MNNSIVGSSGTRGVNGGGALAGGAFSGGEGIADGGVGGAGRMKLMTMLLANLEIDVNELLVDSCRRSSIDSMSMILNYGACPERAMLDTCERGDEKVLEMLLAHPIKSAIAIKALAAAAECAHARCVRLLVQAGVPVDVPDNEGRTPLFMAARSASAASVVELLASGASVDTRHKFSFCTPLHIAAFNGDAPSVKALLDAGADRQAKDKNGETPLDLAGLYDTECRRLLEAKIKPPPRSSWTGWMSWGRRACA